LIGLLLVLHLFFCLVLFEPKLHTGGDSSGYVSLAESVLRVGDGYADTMAPGEPVPHTKYPPGYPLLLAPLLFFFGRNIVVLKLLSVALSVSSVLVFSLLARSQVRPLLWAVMCIAFAVNPVLVDYSHWLLSEAPFLFFMLLALLFLKKEGEEEEIGKYFWLSILAIVATYYVRSIGIVFIGAGTVYYLIRRRWRKFLYFNILGAALSLPWFIRNQLLEGSATPYIEQFLLKSVYEPELGYHDFWGMVGRFFANLWIYSGRELPRVFVGSASTWSGTAFMKVLAIVLSLVILVGFINTVRRKLGVAEIYFAFSCLAIFLFEEVVSDVRYLVLLVPLMFFYLADGLTILGSRARVLRDTAVPAVVGMVLIAAIGVSSQSVRAPENMVMLRMYLAGDRYAGYSETWRGFFAASDWVVENTPGDAVVTVRKPRLFYLWTGRKVMEYPFSTDPDSVLGVVLGTDYVVVDQVSGTTFRYLVPAMEKAPERFTPVFQTREPSTWVFRVNESQ
jgi:4-amino-4-deoxy-L-arabinose transferase-like glycosyltransferase